MSASIDSTQGLRFPVAALVTAADDVVQRLDQLNAIGASLSAERDINRLLEAILTAAKTITRADGGTLYRVTEEKTLRFEIVRTSSLKYYLGGTTGNPVPFSASDQRLAESLASQAAVALTNRMLINQLESLFESFISLINGAIDEKSPYTGGHCQRVPVLTMLLAEAVNETKQGALADFHMSDKDRYELKIAGLLHDCGKVTTPVHVVDKATKLESIYDRVHLIDTRFEVLKRDAELESLKKRMTLKPMEAAEEDKRLRDRLRQYDEDRRFLHACNIGGERMKDDDIAAVKRIAAYRWRDVSGHEADFLTADELKNLTIRAGKLTDEERKIINHHIVATIRMLEALPWPKHLTKVPEYAGGHHERMDGKGYPKGLTREQMSVQARCMGIADIFEALTAKDRPYKKGKTLSESLEILGKMRLNQHVDPDLFDIFVRRKVYRRYADLFLDKEQIDDVDESRIPGYQP